MAGKKQNMAPMWKKLMENVDLDEPTSFLDHVCLGCTHRECKPNEIIMEEYNKMFESRMSAGATENFQGGRNLTKKRLSGLMTWVPKADPQQAAADPRGSRTCVCASTFDFGVAHAG